MVGENRNICHNFVDIRIAHGGAEPRSAVDRLDRRDLDAEARKPDIGARIVGAQHDRADAKIAQDLRANADVTPLLDRARAFVAFLGGALLPGSRARERLLRRRAAG